MRPGESWNDVLARRSRMDLPWLIVPAAPLRSTECRVVTYRELHAGVQRFVSNARRLAGHEATRALVIADSSVECCVSMLGALSAGLTLVPIAPPTLGRPNEVWRIRFEGLLESCQPALVIGSDSDIRELPPRPGINTASFAEMVQATGGGDQGCGAEPTSIALWQPTSGTTGVTRIVQLSHENLLCNVSRIGERIGISPNDVGATWLPLFHDMGLIGSLLMATYWSMPLVIMSPRTFVARPESWLWAMSRFGVTCSAAPNSAYEICASKIAPAKLNGLDLSRWRVAFNGSELVHAATLARFRDRYATYGLRHHAMYPVYGLAEHTVAATLPQSGSPVRVDWVDAEGLETCGIARSVAEDASHARSFVAVGRALSGHALRIVNAMGRPVGAERVIGEIQLSGPSRMLGYLGAAQPFADGEWLETGDRGYMADGELYVAGRTKHVIKRAGRTFDASAIQHTVQSVEGVRGGVVAAFGVADAHAGTEKLVILAEAPRHARIEGSSLRRAIAYAVLEALGATPDVVELVAPGAIPRTTSGKVQHWVARDQYLRVVG